MIKFEIEFECATTQDAIYALQEIMNQLEDGYSCGYLCSADGSWSCEGEEEEETRRFRVSWDVPVSGWESFMDDGVPRVVEVPVSVEDDEIEDYLYREYGYAVEDYEEI